MVHLSSGIRHTRRVLIVLNVLFLLIGFTVMGVGISIKASGRFSAIAEIYEISKTFGDEVMQWVGVGMIITGIFTVCLTIFGGLGVLKNKPCFLYIYAILLTLIIVFEFVVVVVILVYRKNLWQTYDSNFLKLFQHAYKENQTKTIETIENLEREYQCCGVNGFIDYLNDHYPIPDSCHPHQSKMFHPFSTGCADAVSNWIWDKTPIIAGILATIVLIEIIGVIASFVIGVAISHAYNRINRYGKI